MLLSKFVKKFRIAYNKFNFEAMITRPEYINSNVLSLAYSFSGIKSIREIDGFKLNLDVLDNFELKMSNRILVELQDKIYSLRIIKNDDFDLVNFVIHDLNHGIKFKNFLRKGEVLLLAIQLAKFTKPKYKVLRKVIHRVLKFFRIDRYAILKLDPEIIIIKSLINDKLINLDMKFKDYTIQVKDFEIQLLNCRVLLTKFSDWFIFVITGNGIFRVYRHYTHTSFTLDLGSFNVTYPEVYFILYRP